MTTPSPQGVQVDAGRVIAVLKNRLLDEISKSAVMEAALQDSQAREQAITAALTEMQRQNELAQEQQKETEK
jgi:hypothetical protein